MTSKKLLYFPQLTGLRAVAVTMIYFSHFWVNLPYKNPLIQRILIEFHTGVPIFFVLSGFLIGLTSIDEFQFSWTWIKQFWIKRIIRIYPLYLLLIIVALLQFRASIDFWVMNLTLIKGWFPTYYFSGIAPTWVLTVEMTFYLVVPFIFNYWKKVHWLLMVLIFWGVGLVVASLTSWPFMSIYTFCGRSFEFLIGLKLAYLIIFHSSNKIPILGKTWIGLGIMSVCIGLLVTLQNSYLNTTGLLHPLGFIVNNFGFGFGAMLFIWGLVSEKSIVAKFLSTTILQVLGRSAFIFFLIHYTILFNVLAIFTERNFWLIFVFMWLISIGMYYSLEAPVQRMLTKRFVR